MAQDCSTSGVQTAGVLLKTIPKEQQLAIARELIVNLRSDFDVAAASVAVELVADGNDSTLRNDLLDVLKSRIEHGSPDQVVSLLASSPELLDRLVTLVGGYLEHSLDSTTTEPIKVASEATNPDEQTGLGRVEYDEHDAVSSTLLQWLRFTKIAISSGHLLQKETEKGLFTSALEHLNNTDRATALAARDVVFSLISSTAAQQNLGAVRATIASLITARDEKLQQTLGYALWMRLLAAADVVDLSQLDLSGDSYWEPLLSGLRNGDAERRKMCLDILKRSVALVIEQGKIGAVARIETASPRTTSHQYSRYCAVFETLVLARYTNLVVECERDLNLLSSKESVIHPKWLYVLLSTALDVKTTDQTRKFIGDWILRSDLFSSRFPEGLSQFVSHSLLPWAMEGHLFTGSTKLHDGQTLSSRHGDRLSTFVCNLLVQTKSDKQPELLDAILEFVVRKHATLFAYSAVHLIRGVSRAFETSSTLSLTKQQVEHLLFISALRTLPEVASDYLIVQCSMTCGFSESRTEDSLLNKLSELGQTRFNDLRAASDFVKQNLSRVETQTSYSPAKSQRDIKILASVDKCRTTLQAMSTGKSLSSAQLQNILEDIWSDVEFLEYPRALLVKLPAVFFNTTIYQIAYQATNEEDTGLRDLLVATLPRLLDLTQRRSFLLAPLVGSLRELVLTAPEAASILDLEECILRICQSPPEPNIDLRMEYSTIPLLSNLLKESENTCRDHYFGQGEGYGFAAYLDLISRMGLQHPELIQSLLEKLLARWRKQKVPTPTISAWKTTLQLEVMLLCFEQRSSEVDKDSLNSMLKDLYFILSLEPLPRYRYLIEWTLARIQIRHPELRVQTLDMLSTKDHQSNPKFLASLMKLGVMIAIAESGTEDFASSLATIFIALSSSSKIIIRHEAQWAFPQLMDHARVQEWDAVLANPAHVSLDEYIRSLPRFGDPPAERVMSKLDPVADHTMTNLVEGLWTDLDYTRPPYTAHQDFVDLYTNDARQPTEPQSASCMPLGPQIPKPPRHSTISDEDPSAKTPSVSGLDQASQEEASIALQTKGTAYLKTSLDDPDQDNSNKKHDLLLVASLIENPYNLGGLSRVSEIFGACAMYVRDPRVTSLKDFTSVAVSSHHHVEIAPLPVAEISAWVATKKSEGWTVVGIEQTDRSVLLGRPEAVLPAKTILVLGSESLGMPAAVLGECDLLVEIPQVGVTRSLNVQTAAAIVLFEYGRQHGKEK